MQRFSRSRPRQKRQMPAGVGEPGHTDPIAHAQARASGSETIDIPDHLVSRDDAGVLRREISFGEVKIGAADPAHGDPQANLSGAGRGNLLLHAQQGTGVDRTQAG
jgi:hypothetical protein